ncbi:hypothetical protein GF407_20520 [candidate division KSB1 bacterium]|nr:hypothetical protein [candidate division KSB1 bacterium]
MKKRYPFGFQIILFIVMVSSIVHGQERGYPIIINHETNNLSQIPDHWIDQVRQNIKVYYGHTSHGGQITGGLERLAQKNSKYAFAYNDYLPNVPNHLCFLDTGADPDLFFSSIQGILDANPSINVAMFSWCGEAAWYDVNHYISQMQALETANPSVTFVYMTGNAQEADLAGYNRYVFNQALRQYCRDNNKVLFDFADLDVWHNGDYTPNTYDFDDWGRKPLINDIPLEHPQYYGDDLGHTTYESCENKAGAAWWMLAKIAGWDAVVPVEMENLNVGQTDGNVRLTWRTFSESNNYGFVIERRTGDEPFTGTGFVKGRGTATAENQYEYVDANAEAGILYQYRLKQMDLDGQYTYSAIVEIRVALPAQFNLYQNHPNPFNSETVISFSLTRKARTRISIHNIRGECVDTLIHEIKSPGFYHIVWQGRNQFNNKVPSGIYYCNLESTDDSGITIREFRKMVLIN